MKSWFRVAGLSLGFLAATVSTSTALAARCTGDDNCRACKNCRYCRHCAQEGGSCGVCKKLHGASGNAERLASTSGRLTRGEWNMDLTEELRAAMTAVDAY